MIVVYLLGILLGCWILAEATKKIVRNIEKISGISGIGRMALTSVLVATATSLPELSVSIAGAVSGATDLAFGNAVGSNIANLSLILGLTAIWGKGIRFRQSLTLTEAFEPLALTGIPFLLMTDGSLGRWDGVIMLVIWGIYSLRAMRNHGATKAVVKQGGVTSLAINTGWWIVVLVIGAELVVRLAKLAAEGTGVSQLFIGLFLVSVGTSLPELIFNIGALKDHHKEMAVGNIIGSCVTNVTLVLGLAAVIRPIHFDGLMTVLNPGIQYLFVAILLIYMSATKRILNRKEGLILVGMFVYYTVLELLIY